MGDPEKNAEFLQEVVAASSKLDVNMPNLPKPLTLEEKKYLLVVERGDLSATKKLLQKARRKRTDLDINCVDPLGRGALLMAIDNEDLSMVELLVVMKVETKDALLHAINTEFVEAVELLLEHEELIHKEGEPYSWEKIDRSTATFTPEITPLILAAHKNNYEILKLLLDRGATIPMPHDVKCGCEECVKASNEDSLRYSMSRINAYRALASPSLIALSSSDPLLTAFELSWELRNLAYTEQEFKEEYLALKEQCINFAVSLLSHARSSRELAIILNHDPTTSPYEDGDHMKLARLELAINYKQKKFVAHPNVQQLLASLWYEGLPGFRRKTISQRVTEIIKVAVLFPFYCMLYMLCPGTSTGQLMKKPFMKFLIHSSSYLFFLFLLILMSQRVETVIIQLFGNLEWRDWLMEELRRQRGNKPTIIELAVVWYVFGFLVEEMKEVWHEGVLNYLRNMWNVIDITRNTLYLLVIGLRIFAYFQQQQEIALNPSAAFIPREEWDDFDPQLVAEGLCAAANVFSALKLIHMFSINPHLGPLQISLGRMVIDIIKFLIIYSLVLFAFACGLNQLLWYFADLERQKCYSLPGGLPDWNKNADACMNWRRFANLFEASQSLFWASFGLVGLEAFELTGIKSYTRFWGMLMFGSYSVINVVVLLNLLIAMMSNSFALITERSDTEWKFARTKLWLNYFEEGATLPPPFNIIPTPKNFCRLFGKKSEMTRELSFRRKEKKMRERDYRYTAVMRSLVWRYVSTQQRKAEEREVTEDDINEVKNDISSFRCVLLDILKNNGMEVADDLRKNKAAAGRKARIWERRLLKDFHVAPIKNDDDDEGNGYNENPSDRFRRVARMILARNGSVKSSGGGGEVSHIGFSRSRDSFRNRESLKKVLEEAERQVTADISPDPSPRSMSPYLPEAGSSLVTIFQNVNLEDDSAYLTVSPPPKPSLSPMSTMKKILNKIELQEEQDPPKEDENLMKFSPKTATTPDIRVTQVREGMPNIRSESQSRCSRTSDRPLSSISQNNMVPSGRPTPVPRSPATDDQILNAKTLMRQTSETEKRAGSVNANRQQTPNIPGMKSPSPALGIQSGASTPFATESKPHTPSLSGSTRATPTESKQSTPIPGESKSETPVTKITSTMGTPVPHTDSNNATPLPTVSFNNGEPLQTTGSNNGTPLPTSESNKGTPVPTSGSNKGTPVPTSGSNKGTPVPTSGSNKGTPSPPDSKRATPLGSSRLTSPNLSSTASPTSDGNGTQSPSADSKRCTPAPNEFRKSTPSPLTKSSEGSGTPEGHSRTGKQDTPTVSVENEMKGFEGISNLKQKLSECMQSEVPCSDTTPVGEIACEGTNDKSGMSGKPRLAKQDSVINIELSESDNKRHAPSPFNTDVMIEKLERREEASVSIISAPKVIKKKRAPGAPSRSDSQESNKDEDIKLCTLDPRLPGPSSKNNIQVPSPLPQSLMRNNVKMEGWVDVEEDNKFSPVMTPQPPTPQPPQSSSGGDMSPLLKASPTPETPGKVEDVNTIKRVPKAGWL